MSAARTSTNRMRRARRTRRAHRTKASGFTLLEVMITLGVMLVALMGIVSLQRAAIRANIESRATSTATANNERWAANVRREALVWTTSSTGIAQIPYLNQVLGAWVVPVGRDPFGVDWFGEPTSDAPTSTTGKPARYCTLLRVRDLVQGSSMRIDIVTFWASQGGSATSGALRFAALCVEGNGATAGAALFGATPDTNLRHVRSSIVVRMGRP